MRLAQSTFRAILTVSVVLVLGFVITGFASTAYRRERTRLGQAHYNAAQGLAAKHEMEPALEEYRKALLFQPDKTEYRLSFATALIDAGRLDEAESHIEQLLEEDPTNGLINLLQARVAMKRHNLKEAVEDYQRAVYEYWPSSEVPQRREARWELANLLIQSGDRSQFIAELMQLHANAPAGFGRNNAIAFLLLRNGAVREASQVFQDVLRQEPQDLAAHRGLGQVFLSSGDYVEARHEFQHALRIDPKDHESEESLALTNSVIDIDPELPRINVEERRRRSQNLLGRVLKHLQPCSEITGTVASERTTAAVAGPATPADTANQSFAGRVGAALAATLRPNDSKPKPLAATSDSVATPPEPSADTLRSLSAQLDSAEKLLTGHQAANTDPALRMQDTAQQLWRDRATFCPNAPPVDKPLDIVMARMNHE